MRPDSTEYNSYYANYVSQVPDGDIVSFLVDQGDTFDDFVSEIPEEKRDYCYVAGKWTVAQVIQHLIDAERVFAYRILRIARKDRTPMPGFDQEMWADQTTGDRRSLSQLAHEFATVRMATLSLAESLSAEQLASKGTASGSPVSARALLWIIAGHTEHHMNILRERYGVPKMP